MYTLKIGYDDAQKIVVSILTNFLDYACYYGRPHHSKK